MSNPIPVGGLLPRDKEEMLAELREGLASISPEARDSHPSKGMEGALRW